MPKVQLTVATWEFDRVRPIMGSRVKVEGCDVNFITVKLEECFHRAWNHQEFDVPEIGPSGYIIGASRGLGTIGARRLGSPWRVKPSVRWCSVKAING